MSASGDGSDMAKKKRSVCMIALAGGCRIRIGLRRNSGRHSALDKLPKPLRKKSFSAMAAQMRAAGEDVDLTNAVAALARPKVYETVLEAVHERVGEKITDA
jgi:hypothetical protein